MAYLDYYVFGMLMPNRSFNADGQRYLYHGMEQDMEVSGTGNSYTTEFRQYDPRLGRWKSLDPLMAIQPNLSPYQAFNNNPVYFVDPTGLIGGPAKGADRLGSYMEATTHTTKSGDTYGKLSKEYGVSVDDLREWNGYGDREIPVGVDLIVSEPQLSAEGITVLADKAARNVYQDHGQRNAENIDYMPDLIDFLYMDDEVSQVGEYLSHGDILSIADFSRQQISVLKRATVLYFREDTYSNAVNVAKSDMTVEEKANAINQRNNEIIQDFGLTVQIFNGSYAIFSLGQSLTGGNFIPTPKSFTGPRQPVMTYSGSSGQIHFSSTPSLHMSNPNRYVPVHLQRIALQGKAHPDPQGSSAMMYYSRITRNGKTYNLEVLYHKDSNTIWHFEYSRKAMGPLPAIIK